MRTKQTTYSVTDDCAGVTVEQDETAEAGKVSESQAVRIVLTQGQHTYSLDTAQSNPLAAWIRSNGVKAGKRGRKASA